MAGGGGVSGDKAVSTRQPGCSRQGHSPHRSGDGGEGGSPDSTVGGGGVGKGSRAWGQQPTEESRLSLCARGPARVRGGRWAGLCLYFGPSSGLGRKGAQEPG